MTSRGEKQLSFFGEEEKRAREFDIFKEKMEKAFGVPFEDIDPFEMFKFIHQVNEDERNQDEEVARINLEEAFVKQCAGYRKAIDGAKEGPDGPENNE